MTRAVAAPRGILPESRDTAGSMAREMNQPMTTSEQHRAAVGEDEPGEHHQGQQGRQRQADSPDVGRHEHGPDRVHLRPEPVLRARRNTISHRAPPRQHLARVWQGGGVARRASEQRRAPDLRFRRSGALLCTGWQVKDSNLRSFRDGFTVRSHWPLGQPAWCAWKDSKQRTMPNRQPHPRHRPGRTRTMADSSFDIVSKFDKQEVANALNSAAQGGRRRATTSRTSGASIEWQRRATVLIKANTEERAQWPSSTSSRPGSSSARSR